MLVALEQMAELFHQHHPRGKEADSLPPYSDRRLPDFHCVLELKTVAIAVSPSDNRVPHYNFTARGRSRVRVLYRDTIPDLQICKDNRP